VRICPAMTTLRERVQGYQGISYTLWMHAAQTIVHAHRSRAAVARMSWLTALCFADGPAPSIKMKGIELKGVPTYLDMQATTPLDPRVLDAMLPYWTTTYGNPHSRTHLYGWESEDAVEVARKKVADLIGACDREPCERRG
jgi:hypothetical protein